MPPRCWSRQRILLECAVAFERGQLRLRVHHDGRVVFNAANQIARHGVRQTRHREPSMWTRRAVEARNTAACPAALPAADNRDIRAYAQLRFGWRRAVVDAGAFEYGQVRNLSACDTPLPWR